MLRAHCPVLAATFVEEVAIAMFGHPAGAGKMAIVNAPGALGVGAGVDLKNHRDGLAPICAIGRRVEHAHVELHMFMIVVCQLRAVRRSV